MMRLASQCVLTVSSWSAAAVTRWAKVLLAPIGFALWATVSSTASHAVAHSVQAVGLQTGASAVGLLAGDLRAGDLPAGDLAAGDLRAGDLPDSDLPAGDLPAGGLAEGAAMRRVARTDTVHLGAVYSIAESTDPRHRQIGLVQEAGEHALAGLATRRRPQLDVSGRATYQSETASIPFDGSEVVPFSVPIPPKDQYEIAAEVGQLLYDGGRLAAEETIQRLRVAEREAGIRAALYSLRPEVNGAFFAALLHQEQQAQLAAAADDLAARRRVVAAQVRQGAALPSDVAAVDAELLHLEQRMAGAEAARRAALRRLELLMGRGISPGDVLAVPDLSGAARNAIEQLNARSVHARAVHALSAGAQSVDARRASPQSADARRAGPQSADARSAGAAAADISQRPELERFARARARAHAEATAQQRELRPKLSAFARGAIGRPGYDFFDDAIRPYGMVGVRAQWSPIDWGAASQRSAAALLEADVIAADEAAFEARLHREVLDAVYAVERLEGALASDDHTVALRVRIERAALRQLEEGVLLAAEYVQKRNDVLEARLSRSTHRVELAEARARLLTVLGIPISAESADGLHEPVAPPSPLSFDHPSENR